MQVKADGANLSLIFPYNPIDVERAKAIPQRRFDSAKKAWVFKPTIGNLEYVLQWFPDAIWCDKSKLFLEQARAKREARDKVAVGDVDLSDDLSGVPFKLPPFDHQRKALLLGRNNEVFAYLMDQGTGKSKVLLDDAAHNYRMGKIDTLIVVCPNSVKTNWVNPSGGEDEVSKHLAPDIPHARACWSSAKGWQWCTVGYIEGLYVYSINIECLHVDRIFKELEHICKSRNVMIAVDESTRIKNRTAKRTKQLVKLRKLCVLARIMSGTPLIKSPLNAYSQFGFLDPDILGYPNYYSFQNRYAQMGGFQNYQVMFYKNLDELAHRVAGVSYRVMKEDCLDLPPKVYSKRFVELTDEQRRIYRVVSERILEGFERDVAEHGELRPDNVLTQLLRLQQITAGFVPILDELGQSTGIESIPGSIPGSNPKLEELMAILEEVDGKVIVWCKFRAEIQMVSSALLKSGIGHCLFYGDVSEEDRIKAREAFQNDEVTKVFVGQVATGGIGITLTAAKTVIYLSNTFATEDRVQSEDRAHRIGQSKSVDYIDIIANKTVDAKILSVLRSNKRIADEVMRDGYREWI